MKKNWLFVGGRPSAKNLKSKKRQISKGRRLEVLDLLMLFLSAMPDLETSGAVRLSFRQRIEEYPNPIYCQSVVFFHKVPERDTGPKLSSQPSLGPKPIQRAAREPHFSWAASNQTHGEAVWSAPQPSPLTPELTGEIAAPKGSSPSPLSDRVSESVSRQVAGCRGGLRGRWSAHGLVCFPNVIGQ